MENIEIDFDFKPEDWIFETSSGYAGKRNIHTGEWVHSDVLRNKELILTEFKIYKELNWVYTMDEEEFKTRFKNFKNNGYHILKND